ncbi:hypothetical protein APED_33595 [Acanthopleuribacter pedis]
MRSSMSKKDFIIFLLLFLPKKRDKSEGFWLKIWSEMVWEKPAGVAHDAHPLGAVSIFTDRCSPEV